MEPVDLNETAREVIALSSTEVSRDRVIVRTLLSDEIPPALGDRIRLQQALLNLVLNAADAVSEVHARPRELLLATSRQDDNWLVVSVSDSGLGIDPLKSEKLFEAFYTTKAKGMGIGLAISRAIIEGHGGRIWAAVNDGPGAIFSFSIPRMPDG
jgi:signal transduction histidine kinase